MTNKINGIDVSECEFLECGMCNAQRNCDGYTGIECKYDNENCYYRQLKRLEQERDELQDKYSKMIHKYNDLYEKYRAKEILEPDLKNEIKKFDALSIKYGQALEEIRDKLKLCLDNGYLIGNADDVVSEVLTKIKELPNV